MLLRERFGDLDAARQVLTTLEEVLDTLDQPEPAHDDTPRQKTTPSPRRTRSKDKD